MIYINAEGEYPRHIGDIQLVKKDWQEGDALPTGWQAVVETERPVALKYQVAYYSVPVGCDGVLTQGWTVRDLTNEEIARRDAPKTAKAKLAALGLTDVEISALVRGLI